VRRFRVDLVTVRDLSLVLACAALSWAGTRDPGHTPGMAALAWLSSLPGILVLPFRRRHPAAAWTAWVLPNTAYWALAGAPENAGPLVSGMVLLYAAGRWAEDRRTALLVLGTAVPALVLHEVRDPLNTDLTAVLHALPYDGAAPAAWLLGAFIRLRAEQRRQLATSIAAEERRRIARELHDVVAHGVSVMVVQAEGAAAVIDQDPHRAQAAIERVADTGRSSLIELRRALGMLAEPDDPRLREPVPGLAHLDMLLDRIRASGLAVEHVCTGTPQPLTAGADLGLYRAVQEALTNTLRHSRASSARVEINYRPDSVRVDVVDTGEHVPGGGGAGQGLPGLAERMRSLGGTCEAGPTAAGGFRVSVTVPTDSRASEALA
jgi:signal transduction histidine kinase